MKRIISACLCLCLVLFTFAGATAYAEASFDSTKSNAYIESFGASVSISGGSVIISHVTNGTGIMSQIGIKKIQLYENGSLRKVFYSTNALYAPYMMGSNALTFSSSVSYPARSGSSYYAYVSFYASNSSGSGSEAMYTNTVTAP